MPGIRRLLESGLEEVEPHFLRLGQELQSIHSDAEELTRLTAGTARGFQDADGAGALNKVGDLTRESLEALEKCRREVSESLRDVEASVKHLERLRGMCPVIKRIAKSLNIIALNIAVESSRSEEGEEMFSFFVKEIRELSRKVNEISRDINENSATAQSRQLDVFRAVSGRKGQIEKIADEADSMVKGNVREIEQLLAISARALKEVGERSEEISERIGEVVVAIQFQDITKQQLEHVIHAIKDMENLGKEKTLDADDEGGAEDELRHIHSVLEIESAQVRQVIQEISEAHENILTSFGEIGKEIESLVKGTTHIWSETNMEKRENNPFEAFISGYSNLDNVFKHGHDLARNIEEAMAQSSGTVSLLSQYIGQIEDISSDLHIKAINAIIMSSRLGQGGSAFGILAQDVTEISKESNQFATEVVAILKSISEQARTLSCLSSGKSGDKNGDIQGDEEDGILSVIDQISEAYRDFREDSSRAHEYSRALKERILRVESGLSFLEELVEKLNKGLKGLENITQLLGPVKTQGNGSEGNLDHISNRYTMKIERDIHYKTMPAKIPRDDKNISELGDNVELF